MKTQASVTIKIVTVIIICDTFVVFRSGVWSQVERIFVSAGRGAPTHGARYGTPVEEGVLISIKCRKGPRWVVSAPLIWYHRNDVVYDQGPWHCHYKYHSHVS
jgi:hypothetical protein